MTETAAAQSAPADLPNRYVLDGLVQDAIAGRRVLFVGASARHARAALEACAAQLVCSPYLKLVRRANGEECVTTVSGGSIRFRPPTHAIRGCEVDVAYVDARIPASRRDAVLELVYPAVVAAGGEVIF